MDNIFVSIIINNYNYGHLLGAAIDSALNQTYPYREVIVVDDGSNDDSREVIHTYGLQIITVLKNNGGQASAFNAGWEICRGDLVLFLDSDDLLLPTALAAVVKAYNTNHHLGIAKLQYTLQVVSASGISLGYDFPEEHPIQGSALDLLLGTYWYPTPPTSGNVFPRAALEAMMPVPEEEYRICADSYLLLHAPFLGQVVPIKESLGQYRIHGNNYWAGQMYFDRLMIHLSWYERNNQLLMNLADKYGLKMVPPTKNWNQMKFMMMRYKLGMPLAMQFRHNAFSIAAAGIRGTVRDPYLNIFKKTAYSLWFALVALIPHRCQGPIRWLFTHFYSRYDLKYRMYRKTSKMKG